MKKEAIRKIELFNAVVLVLKILNSEVSGSFDKAMQAELRRLVLLWHGSGPNTRKLMHLIPVTVPCSLVPDGARLEARIFPAGLITETDPSPEVTALITFLQFLVAPAPEQLAGPCACGCGQFFLKKSKYRKTHIQGHAARKSASASMKKKQAAKRAPRIRAVNRALTKYKGPRVHGDWKEFVEAEVELMSRGNISVTIKRLTEWAEKGWIEAPQTWGRK
jgi:hypothetical protein